MPARPRSAQPAAAAPAADAPPVDVCTTLGRAREAAGGPPSGVTAGAAAQVFARSLPRTDAGLCVHQGGALMDCVAAPGQAEAARLARLLVLAAPGVDAATAKDYCSLVLLQLQYLLVAVHSAAQAKATETALAGAGCLLPPAPAAAPLPPPAAASNESVAEACWSALRHGLGASVPVSDQPTAAQMVADLRVMEMGKLPAAEPPADAKTSQGALLRFVILRWMRRLAIDLYLVSARPKMLSRDHFMCGTSC